MHCATSAAGRRIVLLSALALLFSVGAGAAVIPTSTGPVSAPRLPEMLLEPVVMNEELDAHVLVANLTRLIADKAVGKLKFARDILASGSLKFYKNDAFDEQQDYFALDASTARSSVLLRTNTFKKVDREFFCRAGAFCSCEPECRVALSFVLAENQAAAMGAENGPSALVVRMPVIVNDINDNSPAFYQDKIHIDIDLDQPVIANSLSLIEPNGFAIAADDEEAAEASGGFGAPEAATANADLIRIPLRLGYDLDSTARNRIQSYHLTQVRGRAPDAVPSPLTLKYVKYDSVHDQTELARAQGGELSIYLNKSASFREQLRASYLAGHPGAPESGPVSLVERFKLDAIDPDFKISQEIVINLKLSARPPSTPALTTTNNSSNRAGSSFFFEKNFYNLSYASVFEDESMGEPVFRVGLRKAREVEAAGCVPATLRYEIDSPVSSQFSVEKSQDQLVLRLKRPAELSPLYQFKLTATCQTENGPAPLKDSAMLICAIGQARVADYLRLSAISSINGIEARARNETSASDFEFAFQNLTSLHQHMYAETRNHSNNVTLGYLIVNSDLELSSGEFKVSFKSRLVEWNYRYLMQDLFRFDELRDGLYAVRLNCRQFEALGQHNELKANNVSALNFKFELLVSLVSAAGQKAADPGVVVWAADKNVLKNSIVFRIPTRLLADNQKLAAAASSPSAAEETANGAGFGSLGQGISTLLSAMSNQSTGVPASPIATLNLFNSVIIISTASVMLVLFGLVCCIVSLSMYVTSRCKLKRHQDASKIHKKDQSLIIGDCESLRNCSSGQSPNSSSSASSSGAKDNAAFFYSSHTVNSHSLSVSSSNGDDASSGHYLKPKGGSGGKSARSKQEAVAAEIASISGRLGTHGSSGSSTGSDSRSGDSNSAIMVYDIMPGSDHSADQSQSAGSILLRNCQSAVANAASAAVSLIGINNLSHNHFSSLQQPPSAPTVEAKNHHISIVSSSEAASSSTSNNISPTATTTTYADGVGSSSSSSSYDCGGLANSHSNEKLMTDSARLFLQSSSPNALFQTGLDGLLPLPPPPSQLHLAALTTSSVSEQQQQQQAARDAKDSSLYQWFMQSASLERQFQLPAARLSDDSSSSAIQFSSGFGGKQQAGVRCSTIEEDSINMNLSSAIGDDELNSNYSSNDYRNEIFRNSHLIFSKTGACKSSPGQQRCMSACRGVQDPLSTSSILLELESMKLQHATASSSAAQTGKPDEQANYTSSSAVSSASGLSPTDHHHNYANFNTYEARPIRLGEASSDLLSRRQLLLNSNHALRDYASDEPASDEYATDLHFPASAENAATTTAETAAGLQSKSPTCSSSSSGYSGSIRHHLLNYRRTEAANKLAVQQQIAGNGGGGVLDSNGQITCV